MLCNVNTMSYQSRKSETSYIISHLQLCDVLEQSETWAMRRTFSIIYLMERLLLLIYSPGTMGVKPAVKRQFLCLKLATTRISVGRLEGPFRGPLGPSNGTNLGFSTSALEQQSLHYSLSFSFSFSFSPINNSNHGLLFHFHSHRPSSYNLRRQRQIRESAHPSSPPHYLNCY